MEQKSSEQKAVEQKPLEQKGSEQKSVNPMDLQLAHHLINEIFRILATTNPRPYPAQGRLPLFMGPSPEWWQGSYRPYVQVPNVTTGWAGPQWVIPFSQGFIRTQ